MPEKKIYIRLEDAIYFPNFAAVLIKVIINLKRSII